MAIIPLEYILCVDSDNHPIAPQLRSDAHTQGIWHRCSHIWLHDGAGRVLCHQRTAAVRNPLRWESFFGGHNAPDMSPLECARIELAEETGIRAHAADLTHYDTIRWVPGHEFVSVYLMQWAGELDQLQLERDEVATVAWVSLDTLQKVYESHDPAWTHMGYEASLVDRLGALYR